MYMHSTILNYLFFIVLGQFPSRKIAPNPKTNPMLNPNPNPKTNPNLDRNPNPNRRQFSSGGGRSFVFFPDTIFEMWY